MSFEIKNADQRAQWDRYHAGSLGKELSNKKHTVKAVYDFAVLGGVQGALNLVDEYGKEVVIPSGAIVTQVLIDEITNVTSGGAATISLGLNTAVDLLSVAAGAIANFTGIIAGTPTETAAWVKATADRKIVATIGTADLTAGKLNVYVTYMHVV